MIVIFLFFSCSSNDNANAKKVSLPNMTDSVSLIEERAVEMPQSDTFLYDSLMLKLANADKAAKWPPPSVYPKKGALLPFNRIIAYYGNFYSNGMGVLGEKSHDDMLDR